MPRRRAAALPRISKKVTRLYRDHLIKKVSEEKGGEKALFQKTGTIML